MVPGINPEPKIWYGVYVYTGDRAKFMGHEYIDAVSWTFLGPFRSAREAWNRRLAYLRLDVPAVMDRWVDPRR